MKAKKRTLSRQQKDALKEKIVSILEGDKRVVFAYIFGSFVKSDEIEDIDIGIFALDNELENPLEYELKLEGDIETSTKIPVDVRVLNNAPASFVFNVIKGGYLLIDRDSNLRADFESLMLKRYFDFEPFRKEYLREILNATV